MSIHTEPPLNTVEVNAWLDTAVRYAGEYRNDPGGHDYVIDEVRDGFKAFPVQLQPLAMDRLEAFVAGANDSTARVNAALVLQWLEA